MTRPTLTRRSMTALLLSAATLPLAGPLAAQDRALVAVDNYPLAYFAQRLAGDHADVLFAVPAGTDPSFWRPGIGDISAMQSADVIAFNGAGFADWATKVSLPRSRIVDTSVAFEDQYIATETVTHSHGEAGSHSHTGTANYTWLDFTLAARQAEALAARMIRALPDAEGDISANLDALRADLAALDAAAKDLTDRFANETVIASHPRYQYFARAYGLEVSSLEWDAQDEVSEAQWQALADLMAQTGATVFFWEAEPSANARTRMAEMGLTDIVFAPLANAPETGDFLSEMNNTLAQIKQMVAN